MKTIHLPNGLTIKASSQIDAKVLYHQMFSMQPYLQHGIQIHDGDCIFDVGANIGLFSISLAQSFQHLSILAFEPVPDTYAALESNAKHHLIETNITLVNAGLSDRTRTAQFSYHPALSMMSGMYSKDLESCVRQDVDRYDWMKAIVLDLQSISGINATFAQLLVKLLSIPVLRSLTLALLTFFLGSASLLQPQSTQQVSCHLKTVSEVIRDYNIQRIDLMKIDVEGSEADVLMGIQEADWMKIQQFVVEVHAVGDRVNQIVSLFERNGYRTKVDQEDWKLVNLMNIFTVYAIRNQ